jgi:hypothetical protein
MDCSKLKSVKVDDACPSGDRYAPSKMTRVITAANMAACTMRRWFPEMQEVMS